MKTTYLGCDACKHLHEAVKDKDPTCDAFPDGVPIAILFGQHIHTEPFAGDHGIMFEQIEPENKEDIGS